MDLVLDQKELRVLGCLIEKALATPEYYPLSLNALTNACNQKSNRYPVVAYNEADVQEVVDRLAEKGVVRRSIVGRVPKYEELFTRERNLVPREAAILCELLLRGAQTPGELRGRTARLHAFDGLEEVLETLQNLCAWGYLQQLPRMTGHKECRYVLLLEETSERQPQAEATADEIPEGTADIERIERIEREVADLKAALEHLQTEFALFRRQFD